MTATVLAGAETPPPAPSSRRRPVVVALALALALVAGAVAFTMMRGGTSCPPGAGRFAEQPDPDADGVIATVRYDEVADDVTPPWQREEAPDGEQGRIAIEEAPACGPELALRAEVRSGDAERERYHRAEVYWRHPEDDATQDDPAAWPDPIGSTRWYGYSIYFPADHVDTTGDNWLVVTQLKGFLGGSPPIAIEERDGRLELASNPFGERIDLGPVRKGVWQHLAVGVHRDVDDDGWVEIWRDGELAGGWEGPTMERLRKTGPPDPTYFKLGVYRSDRAATTRVWFGPLVLGESREAVTPG